MNEIKPWYASKTIWSALVAAAAALGGFLGYDFHVDDQKALTESILQLITVMASVMAVLARIKATSFIR